MILTITYLQRLGRINTEVPTFTPSFFQKGVHMDPIKKYLTVWIIVQNFNNACIHLRQP